MSGAFEAGLEDFRAAREAMLAANIDPGTAAELSVAVSMKRIADVLDGLKTGDVLAGLNGIITNMAWEAGRSFAAGQRTDR